MAQFARVRPSLEEIIGMIEQDPGIQRLTAHPSRALHRLSCAPASGRHRTRLSRHGDKVEFIVSTQGLAISASRKGFVHATAPTLMPR